MHSHPDNLAHLEVDCIRMEARPGAILHNCYQNAVVVASTQKCNVEFIHNRKTFRVRFCDLIACIKEVTEEDTNGG